VSISKSIRDSIEKSSWIRKMFEEGARLKEEFGSDNVYDFSLGNPDLSPPAEFFKAVKGSIENRKAGVHGYMPNSGFPEVRNTIAGKVAKEHNIDINGNSLVMTCGAAGGMNVILKTILEPGEEVIVIKPYFAEYGFYISNHQGIMVTVDSNEDFSLNIEKIEKAITDKTRAIIINSPNNPTGKIYKAEELSAIAGLLSSKEPGGRPVFLLSDEPYREIVYDGNTVPPLLSFYKNSMVINSYSKSLSLPGERIGYIAVNPEIRDYSLIMAGLNLCNRILGFVNAPALMQRVVAELCDVTVNLDLYKSRRNLLSEGLKSAGYDFIEPEGAFYIFCKSPVPDDVEFVRHLQKYNILAVPGSGFGGPGYFRIAYCVSENVIKKALPEFEKALKSFLQE
jgi:aspartate aminotransferase